MYYVVMRLVAAGFMVMLVGCTTPYGSATICGKPAAPFSQVLVTSVVLPDGRTNVSETPLPGCVPAAQAKEVPPNTP